VARALGRVTAELHLALAAAGEEHPAFTPEPVRPDDVQRWIETIQREALATFDNVGRQLDALPGAFAASIRNELAGVIRSAPDLRQSLEALRMLPDTGVLMTRAHGDYHLGQILRSSNPERPGGEWVVVDFEGEPARPLQERRSKQSPLRDVAGMLRSFDYAVQMGYKSYDTDDFMVRNSLRVWSAAWQEAVRREFLGSYRETAAGAAFLPRDEAAFQRILAGFELEKALYELGYELNNRPDWIWVPVQGILAVQERIA
jgi:maltose alpha-D-glucosyltransferase / alpha-amylase